MGTRLNARASAAFMLYACLLGLACIQQFPVLMSDKGRHAGRLFYNP